MVLEIHMNLCMIELDFPQFFFPPPKIWKRTKTGLETVFFELIEKIGLQFLLNLLCNENICYLQFSCANGMFGKIFVPEIWA